MATTDLELRLLIDKAKADLDRLEKHFESTTRDMDADADKVDFAPLRKDVRGLEDELGKAKGSAISFSKVMAGLGAIVSIQAISRGLRSMTRQLGEGVQAAQRQAEAMAQVEQGIESTGGAAGRTSEQLLEMATELEGLLNIDDDVLLKEATANLLTFTNIADERFDRTIRLAADLAVRIGGDLKSATIQLGKALNDPVANLSALSRSGIQFSESQKAVIKELAETNRLADAQTIILDELDKQYGGSAQAAAEAGIQVGKLNTIIANFRENVAAGLVPTLADLTSQIVGSKGEIEALGTVIGDHLPPAIFRLVASFQAVMGASLKANEVILRGWAKVTDGMGSMASGLANVLGRIPEALREWLPGVEETRTKLEGMAEVASGAAKRTGELADSFERFKDETLSNAMANWQKAGRDWRDVATEAAGETGALGGAADELGDRAGVDLPPKIEEGKKAIASLGEAAKTATGDLEQLARTDIFGRPMGDPASVQESIRALEEEKAALEARDQVGEGALQVGERLAQIDTELARARGELRELELQGVKTSEDLAKAQVQQAGTSEELAKIVPAVNDAYERGEITAEDYRKALAKLNEAQGQVSEGLGKDLGQALSELSGELGESGIKIEKTADGFRVYNDAAKGVLDVMTPLGKEVSTTAEATEILSRHQEDFTHANVETLKALEDHQKALIEGKPLKEADAELTGKQAAADEDAEEKKKSLREAMEAELDLMVKIKAAREDVADSWVASNERIIASEEAVQAACKATLDCLNS